MYGDILLEIEEDGKTFYASVSPSGKTNYSHKGGRIVEGIGLEGNDSKNKAVEKSTSAGDIYKVYADNIGVQRGKGKKDSFWKKQRIYLQIMKI